MTAVLFDLLVLAAVNPNAVPPVPVVTESLSGQYLEVRTCDVYTGACFANAEVNEIGKEATLGWKFESGAIDGVDLEGRSVVAVIRNENTLGKPRTDVIALETVLYIDDGANAAQHDALVGFAKGQLGAYSVSQPITRSLPIELATGCCDKAGCAKLVAGDEIAIETRCVCAHDKHCGNETLFYPPLSSHVDIVPAVATLHEVRSDSFSVRFTDRESRGAMTGRFEIVASASPDAALPDAAVLPVQEAAAAMSDDAKPATAPAKDDKAKARAYELSEHEADSLPKQVPEAFAKLTLAKGLRLNGKDGKPLFDLWLRKEVPFLEKPKDSLAIKFGEIALGEFIAVLEVHADSDDFREDHIKAGLYAARYGIQPEDGDHMGTAPNRDFLLLTSFTDDKDVAAISDMDKLGELSILAGEDHPLIWHLRPAESKATDRPTLRHDAKNSLWIAEFTLTGKAGGKGDETSLRAGLVLVGVSDAL